MRVEQAIEAVRRPDAAAMERTKRRLDSIIKPLDSLGLLERHLVKIAGMIGRDSFDFHKKAAVVFCADNGVVAQGITQSGQEVTAIVAENMTTGDTCLCAMCKVAGAQVIPVDIGIATELEVPGLLRRKVAYGTADFSRQPAMTREQAVQALEVGIQLSGDLRRRSYGLLSAGEMGIGNTTAGAAMAAVLLGVPPRTVTGRGAGLSLEGLARKIRVIQEALDLHRPNREDPLDVLCKVGGLEIAGMAGLCIGAGVYGIPVVLDGMISCVAALLACRICPGAVHYLLPSHLSPEPACAMILEELGLTPLLHAGMRVGEGTGAVATFPLYVMILRVYEDMVCFEDEEMEAYQPL